MTEADKATVQRQTKTYIYRQRHRQRGAETERGEDDGLAAAADVVDRVSTHGFQRANRQPVTFVALRDLLSAAARGQRGGRHYNERLGSHARHDRGDDGR